MNASGPISGPVGPRATVPDLDNVRGRLPTWRWIFPSAPTSYSTVDQSHIAEWFDIWSLADPETRRKLQAPGLRAAVAYTLELAEAESRRLPPDGRLVLGGISQGAAMAIHALLANCATRSASKIAGFIGFSTSMPFAGDLRDGGERSGQEGDIDTMENRLRELYAMTLGLNSQDISDQNAQRLPVLEDVPIHLEHCQDDDVIEIRLGRAMQEMLETLGLKVVWKEHEVGGHWIKEPEGMNNLVSFLRELERSVPRKSFFSKIVKKIRAIKD